MCVIEPGAFIDTLYAITDRFKDGVQEDAQEFMTFLLDTIHEDLNRAKKAAQPVLIDVSFAPKSPPHFPGLGEAGKHTLPKKATATTNLELQAKRAWEVHLTESKSIIVDIFQGQLKSSLHCSGCSRTTHSFDPVMYFSLPFPSTEDKTSDRTYKLEELFTEYTKVETLDQNLLCEGCKQTCTFTKQISIWKYPNILLVHLKRFTYENGRAKKINSAVDFSIESLDLTSFAESYQPLPPMYSLFAVCVIKL